MADRSRLGACSSTVIRRLASLIRGPSGGASLAAAVYTQRYQDRLQRLSRESTKRENVYAEFIMTASVVILNAYVAGELILGQDQQKILGIVERIKLFAPAAVVAEAKIVVRSAIQIALQSKVELRAVTAADLELNDEQNLLDAFSKACRADLDSLHRIVR